MKAAMVSTIEFSNDPAFKKNIKIENWVGDYPAIFQRHRTFRFMLSTHDVSCSFVYNGLAFKTVQHALQYMKYTLQNDTAAKHFSLTSNTSLAKRSARRAYRIGSRLSMTAEQKKKWDAMHDILVAEIMDEKYAQNAHAPIAQVLCATQTAELWFVDQNDDGREKKIRAHYLEQIRDRLQIVRNVVESCLA